MAGVYVVSDNIISPIGLTTDANFEQIKKGVSGIGLHHDTQMAALPFYASLFKAGAYADNAVYTKFEQLLIASIEQALQNTTADIAGSKTGLIISSTKGNIGLLENNIQTPQLNKRIALHTSANLVAGYFGITTQPVVVSNACISGILGILTAKRLIESGQFNTVIVSGADVISQFILSGFQSFNAISAQPCRPFDADRDGITLGEGAATIILSSNSKYSTGVEVTGGSTSNDANHISAPSRTGEELAQAINTSLSEAQLLPHQISLISAHGTATLYNDEMEARAITLAGLKHIPVNSLKGFYGHTLGAAGLLESIMSIKSLKENVILPTPGFKQIGVTTPINVSSELTTGKLTNCLKTASGFGGCNGAVIFSKTN
ncbi:beta-ketoacyl-[acyl-carrier-protein] synthase family protein [Mucilaginibacter gracilis]|nr:beta-ketoacyl synthase N-terminal-like domain-containing protein [Mucilaginibacter gracilis]